MNAGRSDLRGILLAITGFTFWVLADSSIKIVGASRLPAYEIIAFLGIFVSAAVAAYAAARGDIARLRPHKALHQAVRSSLDLGNNLCVVVALRHVSLPLFYILVFMAPLVITVLASIFLHEKIGTGKAIAVVAGFAGVIVAVNPFGSSRQGDWIGFGACMVCVACFSINMVWSRVLTRTETAESLTFFSGLVMAVAGFGAMAWHTEPIGGRWMVALLAMGLFCAVGSISFFVALKHTTASNVSQYHYTQLLTGSAVSYLIWRQLPTLSMLAGGALIVGAGLYVALRGARVGVADHG
jgi:drug/metabolite transporter (DMT)-like permease